MLTTNLEYWDAVKDTTKPYLPGGPGIVGGDLPGNVYDNPNYTWREYGQRVGVWRMFDIFDEFKVPSTCTMNAKMGIERRAVVDAALQRGWEIVAHNYVQTELLTDYMFDEAKEREVIRETLQVYREVCGKPAKGWLSSSLRSTLNTIDIIAEEGLIFITDLLNDDQPYLVETRSGKTDGVDPLHVGSQRLHRVHAPGPDGRRRRSRCSRSSSTGSIARARRAAAS